MLDGSNCLDTKMLILSMKEEKPWMLQMELIMKTEMFLCIENTMDSTKNGISGTLMPCHLNSKKVIWTKTGVSELNKTSTLLQK
jgi:hypothetical protein